MLLLNFRYSSSNEYLKLKHYNKQLPTKRMKFHVHKSQAIGKPIEENIFTHQAMNQVIKLFGLMKFIKNLLF